MKTSGNGCSELYYVFNTGQHSVQIPKMTEMTVMMAAMTQMYLCNANMTKSCLDSFSSQTHGGMSPEDHHS